jgi:hypothetical protein
VKTKKQRGPQATGPLERISLNQQQGCYQLEQEAGLRVI